jgi:hypothetical protein
MVEVKIRFLTDDVTDGDGMIIPKHVNARGFLTIEPNEAHGITRTGDSIAFNSLLELPARLEKLLIAEGIVVHPTSKMRKYQGQ